MRLIKLSGKHAVGNHMFAIVDDDMADEIGQYAWKAKPNGSNNNVYAVRNTVINGRNVTIRMHRVVVGYEGDLDVDHINRDSLDNRKKNLRVVTRSVNIRNSKTKTKVCQCVECRAQFSVVVKGPSPVPARCPLCSQSKQQMIGLARQESKAQRWNRSCALCNTQFMATAGHQRFCCEKCKDKAKYLSKKAKVLPSTSNTGNSHPVIALGIAAGEC